MKVILLKQIQGVGKEGDVLQVKEGYARNYLLPKGLALEATEGNLKAMEQKKKTFQMKEIRKKEDAMRMKAAIEATPLVIKRRSLEEGKIFGSVTNSDIAEALAKKGFVVDKKKIVLEKPIKSLGEFEVSIRLFGTTDAKVKLTVTGE